MISREQLEFICISFREVIEKAKFEHLFHQLSIMNNFPYGCCGTTSSLLRFYLKELGIETQEYGLNHNNGTHAILKYNDWIIDLTAA